MRVNEQPAIADAYLARWMRETATQLNLLSEGYVQAATNATNPVPTSGDFSVGDFIRNNNPIEVGTAGSKYVVLGWICTVAGNPGTLLQCRALTGN